MSVDHICRKKLPLTSSLLRAITAIYPEIRQHSVCLKRMKANLVTNVLNEGEVEQFELQVHQYQVDNRLPSTETSDDEKVRIDHWWAAVDKLGKYCVIVKMIIALLSCFHGPQVSYYA